MTPVQPKTVRAKIYGFRQRPMKNDEIKPLEETQMKVKKILSVLLVISMLCSFAFCFASAADAKAIGKALISFVDNGVRTETGVTYPNALGTIYAQSAIDIYTGDTVATVTKRFVEDVKGATANIVDTVWGTKYLASIANVTTDSGKKIASFGEFDGGSWSGWMYKVNNRFSDDAIDTIAVESDDVIEWVFSCQAGPDVGKDFSETSAAITGLTFSTGSLAPAFSADTKDYTLTVSKDVTAVKAVAALKDYATEVTYTLVHGDKSTAYKYNREIPVADGDKIIISTKKVTDLYDSSYNYLETVTDTDSVTVTVKVSSDKSSIVDSILAFFRLIIDFFRNIFGKLK